MAVFFTQSMIYLMYNIHLLSIIMYSIILYSQIKFSKLITLMENCIYYIKLKKKNTIKLFFFQQNGPYYSLFYNKNFNPVLVGSMCLPYIEGYIYCATNFVYEDQCHDLISNRRVIDLGAMLKLESEKWNYLKDVRR